MEPPSTLPLFAGRARLGLMPPSRRSPPARPHPECSGQRGPQASARNDPEEKNMSELIVDFITSLDGYASAEGWPGWWGAEGPEYLAWLDERPDRDYTILMGANTYRLMSGFASATEASGTNDE